ncbi:MAG: hypothetical protein IT450_14725 [Phycisphaerales bacterium]|nr:hypothetical protein [Phycisphaerales bacterium]
MPIELNIARVWPEKFAPGQESVNYEIRHADTRKAKVISMWIEVRDNQGRVVYKKNVDESPKTTARKWDGRGDVANPTAPKKYVSPLGSPYRVRLMAETAVSGPKTASLSIVGGSGGAPGKVASLVVPAVLEPVTAHEVKVLYHSIELDWGKWLSDEAVRDLDSFINPHAPAFATDIFSDPKTQKWVWYKLGTLGYFPGPRPEAPTPDNAMGKAIIRYRQAHKELYTTLFKEGANYSLDGPAVQAAAKISGPLLAKLHAGENNRFDTGTPSDARIIDKTEVISNSAAAKLFVDIDRFYVGLETEFNADSKAAVDRDWVPRPIVPLRVRVRLQKSDGSAADSAPVGAIGDCKLRWKWQDRAEKTDSLPTYTKERPSQTKRYLDKTLDHVARTIPSAYQNSRTAVGGLVSGNDADDSRAPFTGVDSFALTDAVEGVYTAPCGDAAAVSWADCTELFFWPSKIAGDNYKLTVALDLDSAPAGVKDAHSGVASNLMKETGEFEVWRRVPISAYVKWGDVAKAAEWDATAKHFAQAYTKLLSPAETIRVADLIDPGKAKLSSCVSDFYKKEKVWSRTRGKTNCEFSADYVFPEDSRSLEFTNLAAIGEAQFGSPLNVINEMMITPLWNDFEGWRQNSTLPPEKKVPLPDKQLQRRYDFCRLLETTAGWTKRVGEYFKAEIERIWDPGTKKCRDIADNVDRTLKPLRHDDGGLTGAPTRRSAILQALLLAPLQPALDEWKNGSDAPAKLADLKTVRALATGLKTEINVVDSQSDKEKKVPIDPILRGVAEFAVRVVDSDCGAGTAIAYNLHKQNIELVIAEDPPSREFDALIKGPPYNGTLLATKQVSKNRGAAYVLAKIDSPQTFDLSVFNAALPPSAVKVWSFRQLRGPGATLPTYSLPDKEEAALCKRHRVAIANFQIDVVIQKLGPLVSQSLFPEIPATLHAAVRAGVDPGHRPTAGLLVVHYRAHPRPLPIKTGSSADLTDLTNSTSIGADGGLVLCSDDQPLTFEHLFAHEIAHCLFLRHWQKGRDVIAHFGIPNEHDLSDANCMMSYSAFELQARWGDRDPCSSHFNVSKFKPHFCGKCNLKLRGWDLNAKHTGTALLPARSIDVKLLNPAAPRPTIASVSAPDPADLKTHAMDLLQHKLLVTPDLKMDLTGDTLRFHANPELQEEAGKQFFRWPAVEAKTLDKNRTIKCSGNYDLHGDQEGKTRIDADILNDYNDQYGCAWERNLEYYFLSGGATNVPRDILFNPHWSMYTDDTAIHETIHVFQKWDPSRIAYEGMTELFGMMLSKQMRDAIPGAAPKLKLTLNPTYVQGTQFVIDELLPRLGWHGLAKLYFENDATLLDKVLTASGFPDKCEACSKKYDMAGAIAIMMPREKRPPVDDVLHSTAQPLCRSALTEFEEYLSAHNRYGFGPTERALHAKVIRLDAKIKAFEDAVRAAEDFRSRVTETDRVHRLEAWIEDTKVQVMEMKLELP